MSNKYFNPDNVATPPGTYSHGVEIPSGARILHTAGQVGRTRDGTVPDDFKAQVENTWQNLIHILHDNEMTVNDIVSINHFLTDAVNIAAYLEVYPKFLGQVRPAGTLLIVAGLAHPNLKLEVELIAAK